MRTLNFRSNGFNLTKRNSWFSSFLVNSNTIDHGNHKWNHKLWNIGSTEIKIFRSIPYSFIILFSKYITEALEWSGKLIAGALEVDRKVEGKLLEWI